MPTEAEIEQACANLNLGESITYTLPKRPSSAEFGSLTDAANKSVPEGRRIALFRDGKQIIAVCMSK